MEKAIEEFLHASIRVIEVAPNRELCREGQHALRRGLLALSPQDRLEMLHRLTSTHVAVQVVLQGARIETQKIERHRLAMEEMVRLVMQVTARGENTDTLINDFMVKNPAIRRHA